MAKKMSFAFAGECFFVLTPNSHEKSVIFGRNSAPAECETQEIFYHAASAASEDKVECDGNAKIDSGPTFALILQKSRLRNAKPIWGAETGANEKNVCIGLIWSYEGDPDNSALRATDFVRLALERSCTAADAVDQIGKLVAQYGNIYSKFSFAACDPSEGWLISAGNKIWAAQKFDSGFHRLPYNGLGVRTVIDKSTENLADALKAVGLWDEDEELDFAKCFRSPPCVGNWTGEEPVGDGSYILTSMFDTLRFAGSGASRSSTVSVLSSSGISCHWFTATPNPRESVFKPFVFSPNPKISPLTQLPKGESETLLKKLHSKRKAKAIGELKNLEASCVEEVKTFLKENPTPTAELDELMKDCVEAEVKFYR